MGNTTSTQHQHNINTTSTQHQHTVNPTSVAPSLVQASPFQSPPSRQPTPVSKKRKVVVDDDEKKRRNRVNAQTRRTKLAMYEREHPVLTKENIFLKDENRRLREYIRQLTKSA